MEVSKFDNCLSLEEAFKKAWKTRDRQVHKFHPADTGSYKLQIGCARGCTLVYVPEQENGQVVKSQFGDSCNNVLSFHLIRGNLVMQKQKERKIIKEEMTEEEFLEFLMNFKFEK